MKRVMVLSVLFLWGLFSGCIKYPVVGSYYNKEVLIGTADHRVFSGTSYFQVDGRSRKVHCEGDSYATYAPLITLSGAGYGGEGELKCSDGINFKVRWESLSWGTGYGVGKDQHGDRITFVYGMEQGEAEDFLQKGLPAILKTSR